MWLPKSTNIIVAAFEEETAVIEKVGRVPTERLFVSAAAWEDCTSGRAEAW